MINITVPLGEPETIAVVRIAGRQQDVDAFAQWLEAEISRRWVQFVASQYVEAESPVVPCAGCGE